MRITINIETSVPLSEERIQKEVSEVIKKIFETKYASMIYTKNITRLLDKTIIGWIGVNCYEVFK